MRKIATITLLCAVIGFFQSCAPPAQKTAEEIQKEIQEQLINAKSGDVIELPEGTIKLASTLSLKNAENVTIRGKGLDKTILSFADQTEGAEGLKIKKGSNIVLEDFGVEDSKGDGIKVQKVEGLTIRRVKVSWSGGADSTNGGYGLYPVESKKVLVEHCDISGASDAGIYIGQTYDVVVRHNTVYENVAGIEIENCIGADVYKNECYNNTGGILVFDMPDLPLKNGSICRVYDNVIRENNHPNFAPKGNIVGEVPAGSGVMVMAAADVEIFNNTISNHNSAQASIVSYVLLDRPYKDSLYDPFSEGIYIHDNTFESSPVLSDTNTTLGKLIAQLFQGQQPDIMFDGFQNPARDNANPPLCIQNNTGARFANINAPGGFEGMDMDLANYDCEGKRLPEIQL